MRDTYCEAGLCSDGILKKTKALQHKLSRECFSLRQMVGRTLSRLGSYKLTYPANTVPKMAIEASGGEGDFRELGGAVDSVVEPHALTVPGNAVQGFGPPLV